MTEEGPGALIVCTKIKGLYLYCTLRMCACARLCLAGKHPKTPQKNVLKFFFKMHKTLGQRKQEPQQGVRVSPQGWTKGLPVSAEGQEGGQNSSTTTKALWDSMLHIHTHTVKECMTNQPCVIEKTQITLN